MALHVEEYINQTTLEHFPYIRKLNTARIKAMISGSRYFNAVRTLDGMFDPDVQWFLMGELYPGIRQFYKKSIQSALAYGIQRKTLYAMQLMVRTLDLGDADVVYGNAYGRSAPQMTDEHDGHPLDYTDEGSYTDTQALPLYVLWLDYSMDTSIGVPSYDDAVANSKVYGPLLVAVKPGRVPMLYLGRKNLLLSSRKTVGCAQISGPSLATLQNLSSTTLSRMYHSLQLPSDIHWFEMFTDNTKRIFEVRSDVKQETFIFLSGVSGWSDIKVSVLDDGIWNDEMKQFRYRICLNLNKKASTDNFSEVKYG